jgi:putative ABC transport system substrate-binding protein
MIISPRRSPGLAIGIVVVTLFIVKADSPVASAQPVMVPPLLAQDGRALARETQATQAIFNAVWGDRAAAHWVEEHNAALADGRPLIGPHVVFFASSTASAQIAPGGNVDPFVGGLREQGLSPRQTMAVDWRFSEGDTDILPRMASEIVATRPDVIVTGATPESLAAKEVTQTIPIVFWAASDPVGVGLVSSFDRPGGNVTGITNNLPDVNAKRLSVLKDVVPNLSRVAVFRYTPNAASAIGLTESQEAGAKLGLEVVPVLIASLPDGLQAAFDSATAARAQAVVLLPDTQFNLNRGRIVELATANRLPVLSQNRASTEAGLTVSWGPGAGETAWRSAEYVAKILRGAKPSDLAVGVPFQTELVINLKTAQAIGLTVPEPAVAKATSVIR